MPAIQKIFLGFTLIAIVSTLVSSPYTATIFGQAAGGVAKVYDSVKH